MIKEAVLFCELQRGRVCLSPNQPTGVMVPTCGDRAKQCCQAFSVEKNPTFFHFSIGNFTGRAPESDPLTAPQQLVFTGKGISGASLGHATPTGFCSLALYTHHLPPAKTPHPLSSSRCVISQSDAGLSVQVLPKKQHRKSSGSAEGAGVESESGFARCWW